MRKNIMMRYPEGRTKALTFSYDDGVRQDVRFMEILNRYGMRGTFNINSGLYAAEEGHTRMTAEQITKAYANGPHEVAVHSHTHPFLESVLTTDMIYEIMKDRELLEEQFGCVVRGMAYPMGTFSDEVVGVLKNCGIAYARTTVATEKFSLPTDWLRLPATCHHNNPRLMELARRFLELDLRSRPCALFYLWGHTYEFDHNDNWNVIEEFCEYLGGHEDEIWYATSIEIYEYIEDFKRLVTSVDNTIVKNPTARTLWFRRGGEVCSIAPGQTLRFNAE